MRGLHLHTVARSIQTKMFLVGTGVSPNQTKPNATGIRPITRKKGGGQKETMGGKKGSA